MKIALDAMGGDFGPPNLVAGAVMALRDYKQINKLYLVGDSAKVENELRKHQCNDSRIEIVHSTQVVDMSDRAWTAVRRKKDSSISRAVDLVKHGDAEAVRQVLWSLALEPERGAKLLDVPTQIRRNLIEAHTDPRNGLVRKLTEAQCEMVRADLLASCTGTALERLLVDRIVTC